MAGPEQTVGAGVDVARLLLLRDIGRAFNSSLDLDHIFQMVLEKVTQVLQAEAASIWLIQEGSKELFCETAIGPVSDKVHGLRLPWGTGIVGWVAQHAKPVIVADAQKDKFLSKQVDEGTGFVTRSMICAPMVARGKCLGAIQIVNKVREHDLFSREDLELLVDMAIDAAIAVENARLYQAESKVKELQALLKISREIASTLDLDRILKIVVNILTSVVSYDRCSVALIEQDSVMLNAVSGVQVIDRKDPATISLETFLREAAQAQTQGQAQGQAASYLVKPEDAAIAEDRFTHEPVPAPGLNAFMQAAGTKSLLLLPLRDEEGPIGLLCLESKNADAFKPSQIEIVSILAAQATVAIRNGQLYKHVPTLNLQGVVTLLQPRNMTARKLGVIGTLAVLLTIGMLVQGPLTLAGQATVLPSEKISVVAQEGGRLERVLVDEGSVVKAGDVVAELDDADLRLQLDAASTTLEVSRVRARQLRLESDAGALALEEIKSRQAEAEVALLESKIAASRLTAPIDGVVTTPRLREKLGATLSKGEALLDLAGVAQMTVDVSVAESDLGDIRPGQPVAVRLLAYPTRTFDGKVHLISPKAAGPDAGAAPVPGGAAFTVRARIGNDGTDLRAGMQGTARIDAGKRPLLATLARGPLAWLQMTWWRLKP